MRLADTVGKTEKLSGTEIKVLYFQLYQLAKEVTLFLPKNPHIPYTGKTVVCLCSQFLD